MSIIADALKKAQEKRLGRPDTSEMLFNKPPVPSLAASDIPRMAVKPPNEKPRRLIPNISLSGSRVLGPLIVIAAVALLAGGGVLANALLRSGPGLSPDNKAELPQATGAPGAGNNVISVYEKDPAADGQTASGRSYLSPARQKNLSLPVVSGIMYSPRNPQAIVNGILVSEGSIVDGFVLVKILPDNIRVRRGETEYQINLR